MTALASGGPATSILSENALKKADGGPSDSLSGGFAVDATRLYWAGTDGVRASPLSGGTPVTLASGPSGQVPVRQVPVTVDASNIYWWNECVAPGSCNGDALMKAPLSGGAPITLASGQVLPGRIAVDATSVYWTTGGTGSNGTVMSVPLGGGTPTTLASGLIAPGGVAIDSTNIYWSTPGNLSCATVNYTAPSAPCLSFSGSPGGVMKVPLGGGVPTLLSRSTLETCASGHCASTIGVWQDVPAGPITVDATSVYWITVGSSVMKVPLVGGAPVILASLCSYGMCMPYAGSTMLPTSISIAVNAFGLYFTSGTSVMRIPLDGVCQAGVCK
jgi:hypothetical protein